MARAFIRSLLIALAVVFASACGGDKSAAKPTGNEPAGVVVEVSGQVSATSKEAKRALKVGDKVLANETIVTDATASVTIRLFHNDARWELGGGKSRAIRQSLAWNVPKGSSGGAGATDKTMAAGRHAERQAGTTTPVRGTQAPSEEFEDSPTSERANSKSAPARKADHNVAPGKSAPSPAPVSDPHAKDVKKPRPVSKSPALRKRHPRKRRGNKGGRRKAAKAKISGRVLENLADNDDLKGGGSNITEGPGHVTRSPMNKNGAGLRLNGKKGSVKIRGRVVIGATTIVSGIAQRTEIAVRFKRLGNMFRYCYELGLKKQPTLSGALKLTVNLRDNGTVARVRVGGNGVLKATVGRCVGKRTFRMKFPAHKSASVFRQVLTFTKR